MMESAGGTVHPDTNLVISGQLSAAPPTTRVSSSLTSVLIVCGLSTSLVTDIFFMARSLSGGAAIVAGALPLIRDGETVSGPEGSSASCSHGSSSSNESASARRGVACVYLAGPGEYRGTRWQAIAGQMRFVAAGGAALAAAAIASVAVLSMRRRTSAKIGILIATTTICPATPATRAMVVAGDPRGRAATHGMTSPVHACAREARSAIHDRRVSPKVRRATRASPRGPCDVGQRPGVETPSAGGEAARGSTSSRDLHPRARARPRQRISSAT